MGGLPPLFVVPFASRPFGYLGDLTWVGGLPPLFVVPSASCLFGYLGDLTWVEDPSCVPLFNADMF